MAICIMENVEFGATPQLTHGLDMSAAGWVTLPCQLASSQLKERNCCLLLGTKDPPLRCPQTRRLDTGQQLTAPNSCFLGKLILKQSQINHYYPHKMGQ